MNVLPGEVASALKSPMKSTSLFAFLLGLVCLVQPAAGQAPYEPKAGSAERKAIMDAMRAPVSKQIGKPVTFTGQVRVVGSWARFHGNVAPTDGKPPKSEDAKFALDLDFFALLRKTDAGGWEVLHHGFAGDIGVMEAAKEKFPKAPRALFTAE